MPCCCSLPLGAAFSSARWRVASASSSSRSRCKTSSTLNPTHKPKPKPKPNPEPNPNPNPNPNLNPDPNPHPHPHPDQVHEKHVLLPLLPAALLAPSAPRELGWFVALCTFSLFPLLRRDGQALPYLLLTTYRRPTTCRLPLTTCHYYLLLTTDYYLLRASCLPLPTCYLLLTAVTYC